MCLKEIEHYLIKIVLREIYRMKRILILLLTLNCNYGYSTNYTSIERNTIDSAYEALQTLQVLYFISDMCDKPKYIDIAPKTELDTLVQNKLHVSLAKLEAMAMKDETYMAAMEYQKDGITCNSINVDDYLSELYNDYDLLLFSVGLYEPISKPLSNREVD